MKLLRFLSSRFRIERGRKRVTREGRDGVTRERADFVFNFFFVLFF